MTTGAHPVSGGGPRPLIHLDHSVEAGGAELALRRLLVQGLWHATLVIPHAPDRQDDVFADLPVPVAVLRAGAVRHGASRASGLRVFMFGLDLVRDTATIAWRLRGHPATTIHANSTRSGIAAAFVARLTSRALVLHVRDAVTVESLGRLGYSVFTRVALRAASGVVANSDYTLSTAAPHLRSHAARAVIPSPLGLTAPRPKPQVRKEVANIGMVARIDDWKGHDTLIRAYAALSPDFPRATLQLVGGTHFGKQGTRARLEQLAADLGVADRVYFRGAVASDEIARIIADFDVCVHASTRPEPLGQAVLQYLGMGRPTIAADAGGPREWIQHGVNGLLHEAGSAPSLESALRELLSSTRRRAELAAGAAATPIPTDHELATRFIDFVDGIRR